MGRSITARVTTIAFGVELAFALAIPVAYRHLFQIAGREDWRTVIAMVVALYLVRTAGLVAYLFSLLRPVDRWMAASRSASPAGAELTQKAARAAYDSPLVFSLVWAST